jgi:pimeloyl-ACP methyl ester carboxylesterase
MSTRVQQPPLAYETHGSGVPVVFLHGLTFDRTTWRPIIDRLGEKFCSIALDLPGHHDTGGTPCTLDEVAARVKALLDDLGAHDPIVVGHSMSGGIAMIYSATYPVRGAVVVDQSVDVRPFAQLVQRLGLALRGDDFATAFAPFQHSMGLDRIREPLRSQVLATQDIRQPLVLGYWDEALHSAPAQMQARAEDAMTRIKAPFLAVFGHQLTTDERNYLLKHVPHAQLEEWAERGHFVHLAEPDRFTLRLSAFIENCAPVADGHS